MRLFFALWPPPEAARALARWAEEVHRSSAGRATREETIHLTLAFLGEADPEKPVRAARRVRAEAFELPIDAAKYWKHNRIVWVGPAEMPPPLGDLAGQLKAQLAKEGFVLEERPFAAHITLLRKASVPQSLVPLPAISWPAREFVLVRSIPDSKGSRYEIIERFPLKT